MTARPASAVNPSTMSSVPPERPAHPEPASGHRGILCPYCGSVSSADPKRCDRCGGHFDPLSRQATQNAMGPWFIRDVAAPFRPGCSFETLRDLIKRGKITRETILRGPSTRQYWNFASRTPGIANLLGVCHNCHVPVRPDDFSCAACGAVFTPETDRQHMGLAPVHLLPGQAAPEIIAAASMDQARATAPSRRPPAAAPPRAVVVPTRSRGPGVVSVLLALLILLGAAAVGVLRFVLPVLRNEPPPVRQTAALPVAKPSPSEPAEPPPAARKESPSPENPPAVKDTSPAPSTTAPSDPAPAAPAAPKVDPRAELLVPLQQQTPDFAALSSRLSELQAAGLERAEAWAGLIRARAEQARLRALP